MTDEIIPFEIHPTIGDLTETRVVFADAEFCGQKTNYEFI